MKSLFFILVLAIAADISYGQIISWDEFSNAVQWLGYPGPSWDQYHAFEVSIVDKAHISTKQEAAMALTQYIHESDGLRAKREYACQNTGCPGQYETPGCDIGGQDYYGRGYIQLSWCYNYRQASIELYGNDWMIYDADAVARDEYIAWDTAFWFWRANVHYKPGVQDGLFGATTRAINGGLECDGGFQHIARQRYDKYKTVRAALNLGGNGDERGCYN